MAYRNRSGCSASSLQDPLTKLLIYHLNSSVDLAIWQAKLMRDQFRQQIDALDERRSIGHRSRSRGRLEKAFRSLRIFFEGHLIIGVGSQTPSNRVNMPRRLTERALDRRAPRRVWTAVRGA
jgi:hypothetical protein